MRKPLLAFRPRERRLALITTVIIGCWVIISWLVQPLWDRARDLRLHVDNQTQRLDALARLLTQAPSVERDYRRAAPYFETEAKEKAQGSFLSELEALSRTSEVQLSLKPRSPNQGEGGGRLEIELDVEGTQEHMMAFLDALFNLPRLMTIDRLRLSSVPSREELLRANLVIQRLLVRQ